MLYLSMFDTFPIHMGIGLNWIPLKLDGYPKLRENAVGPEKMPQTHGYKGGVASGIFSESYQKLQMYTLFIGKGSVTGTFSIAVPTPRFKPRRHGKPKISCASVGEEEECTIELLYIAPYVFFVFNGDYKILQDCTPMP